MELKNRLYPYPVLSKQTEDYKEGIFESKISVRESGDGLEIDIKTTLTSRSLKELIRNKEAEYVYHIECPTTGFRRIEKSFEASFEFDLSSSFIKGQVVIYPFIIAAKDIESYFADDFHEDYQGLNFDLEAGCILAVGEPERFTVLKEDQFSKRQSIIAIRPNSNKRSKVITVDTSLSNEISVYLPEKDYKLYKMFEGNKSIQPILNSILVVPALTHVFEELKQLNSEERAQKKEAGEVWYIVLADTLEKLFKYDLDTYEFNEKGPLELAQELIGHPVSSALKNLYNLNGETEEI